MNFTSITKRYDGNETTCECCKSSDRFQRKKKREIHIYLKPKLCVFIMSLPPILQRRTTCISLPSRLRPTNTFQMQAYTYQFSQQVRHLLRRFLLRTVSKLYISKKLKSIKTFKTSTLPTCTLTPYYTPFANNIQKQVSICVI